MRFVIVIILIAVLAGVIYYQNPSILSNYIQIPNQVTPTPKPVAPTNPVITSPISPIINNDELRAGGNSHLDAKGVFSILYPNDYVLDTQGDGQYTRIYKRGETQQGQTEMYDGVIIVFETVDLNGVLLTDWVDERIATSTSDGTSQLVEGKKSVVINNYPGFTYTVQGLGISKYINIQKDTSSNNAVVITYSVNDPENKNYQAEVDTILSTIELLK